MRNALKGLLCGAVLCALLGGGAAAAQQRFSDVPEGYWAADRINRAAETGLFNGRSSSWFGAERPMTRAEFAAVLCRLFGWETARSDTGSFTDNQDPSAWYYGAVETVCRHGAVTLQSRTFRPADPITREELSVMLVRALGYSTLAGLAQELPLPFRDVDASRGYLSMAYQLGIAAGTSAKAFSPESPATRAQAAVMLMRVYDKLHAAAPALWGLAPGSESLTTDGMHLVAVPAAALTAGSCVTLTPSMAEGEVRAVRAASAGTQTLLCVSGDAGALAGSAPDTAAALAEAVGDGGYSGLLLDLRQVPAARKTALTALSAAVRAALGTRLLYVTAEAPVWQGTACGGYDFAALAGSADRIVLRVAPYRKDSGGVLTAPEEPLEEIYYALSELKGAVSPSKLSLLLTTTGSDGSDGARIAKLLNTPGMERYYSARYGSAYLVGTADSRVALWYQDAAAAADRRLLCAFFGVESICLSDLTSLGDYGDDSLLGGLR